MAAWRLSVPNREDNYVFIPAACYRGNQFRVDKYDYPPKFEPSEARIDMPVTITDVPRLEPDGSGKIEVTTGDAAIPCVGVFSKSERRGVLVFTVQEIDGRNLGLAYESGEIRVTYPAKRERLYYHNHMHDNPEPWQDLPAKIPCEILDFECTTLAEFFRVFFENRRIMGLDSTRPDVLPYKRQAQIQIKKFNSMNWLDAPGFYMVGTDRTRYQVWQPGWTGGAMSSYALMKLGELEWRRGVSTLEYLFSTQAESGFYYGIVDADGKVYSDAFMREGADSWHLLRKSADVLYFLFKHFDLFRERNITIPERFLDGAKRTADGFVRLWDKYRQFGQFVDIHTGDIIVGGSASAAIAPAGLVRAHEYFGDAKYLDVAKSAAEYYYNEQLSRGYTTGGPGEILQGVDSESGFGLLESFVVLAEYTKDEKWIRFAREAAEYCSSWVVSYNYRFPADSEFGRHNMKTVGSVFANIQNKHSAPGICTLSGDSLYKLYRMTGDKLYYELFLDIATTIGQYMSTDDAPIYDWGLPPKAQATASPEELERHRLPEGFINERVNMSDWERAGCVGGVFHGSCWSETANLLALAESIPLIEQENK